MVIKNHQKQFFHIIKKRSPIDKYQSNTGFKFQPWAPYNLETPLNYKHMGL
jgi:hypothetical protein